MADIISYLAQMMLPAILGALLWSVTRPWRRGRLARKKLRPGPYREGALLIFFMFLTGLLALTLTPTGFFDAFFSGERPGFPQPFQGGVNLFPIKRSWKLLRYYVRNGLWTAILINFPGNIIMFLPVGFFIGLLADKPRWWKGLLLTGMLSLFIEIFQLFISRGTDVDDLILNAFGGLLGYWSFLLLRRVAPNVVSQCAKM